MRMAVQHIYRIPKWSLKHIWNLYQLCACEHARCACAICGTDTAFFFLASLLKATSISVSLNGKVHTKHKFKPHKVFLRRTTAVHNRWTVTHYNAKYIAMYTFYESWWCLCSPESESSSSMESERDSTLASICAQKKVCQRSLFEKTRTHIACSS